MARRSAGAPPRKPKGRARQSSRTPTDSGTQRASPTASTGADQATAPDAVEPEALVVTHWFEARDEGAPYAATIRLTGQRVGVHGMPGPKDTFVREETIDGIVPGTGPVSISSWVYGLEPGEWTVQGDVIRPKSDPPERAPRNRSNRVSSEPLQRARWSWLRWSVSTVPDAAVTTRWAVLAPLAPIPAVLPGSFTVLGVLAIVAALFVQAMLLAGSIPVGQTLVVSVIATLTGLLGAKVWYAVLHPGPWPRALLGGWAVDGFLVVAFLVAIFVTLALKLPTGRFLDATAPGIFVAVAIGRFGCLLTGCCAGRCTSSRWGLWSSDRRIGARRIPTQLLEAAAGLLIAVASGVLVLNAVLGFSGAIFVAAVAAYFLIRQMLLRLRAERRDYLWRRSIPMARAAS